MSKYKKQQKWYVVGHKKKGCFIFNNWPMCQKYYSGKSGKEYKMKGFLSEEAALAWIQQNKYNPNKIYKKYKETTRQGQIDSYQKLIKEVSKGWHAAFKNNKAYVFDNWEHPPIKSSNKKRGFPTKDAAINWLIEQGCDEWNIQIVETEPLRNKKICPVCQNTYGTKGRLCPTCNKIKKNLGLTIWVMSAIQDYLSEMDMTITSLNEGQIMAYARKIQKESSKEDCVQKLREKKQTLHSSEYQKEKYYDETETIPPYVLRLFEKDETKKLVKVSGFKINPKIYYVCNRCGQEQCQTYEEMRIKKGHNCESIKSSGETLVEEYLKSCGIKYKTQRNTLQCINPITKSIMPYDFEIPKGKIIIEVQGNQHLQYIQHFHGSYENFEYQQLKDRMKKEFAENKGYTVIYITYDMFKDNKYKEFLNQQLFQNTHNQTT